MSSNHDSQPMRSTKSFRDAFLVTLFTLLAVGSALGGYFVGRYVTKDSFVERVSQKGAVENTTLVSAGTAPLSLFQVVEKHINDPLTAEAFVRIYNVPVGDRAALATRLRQVIWIPPYQPAPFVGHISRQFVGGDLRINALGFRDERQSYAPKPDRTVRIFITGGSSAWGSGASSQKQTISYLLEELLNEQTSPVTGYRYEVINAAFPAWSTTHEKFLIQQRLVDLHPDAVIMFSGNNDVHWSIKGRDIRWFYTPMDQNYVTILNELYTASGHPEWTFALPMSSRPVECGELASVTRNNVDEAAFVLSRIHSRLIFALQPNIVSTAKPLTRREQQLPELKNKSFWDSCYQSQREQLGRITAKNYQLLDLSRSFGQVSDQTELFIDSYHFSDLGNRLIAESLASQIDWRTIVPKPR